MGKEIKKVAFHPGYKNMLGDRVFSTESEVSKKLGGLPVMERYVELKRFLNEKGIEIHTYDVYKNLRKVDLWIMMEPSPRVYLFMLKHLINPRKVLFFILEPNVVNPWGWKYFDLYSKLHKVFLTWSTELCRRNKKCVNFKVPVIFDKNKYGEYLKSTKENLCVLMQSNKASKQPGEMYSMRPKIIKYFEQRGDKLLDLYGYGWNTNKTRHLGHSKPLYTDLYKGTSDDKWLTYSKYWFVLCMQNTVAEGDYEYDPFMAMAVGSVPVYWPPADVDDYIPKDVYIDTRKFADWDSLVEHLKSLQGTEEYENYRKRGWEYLNSEAYRPFTTDYFSEQVYNAIKLMEA